MLDNDKFGDEFGAVKLTVIVAYITMYTNASELAPAADHSLAVHGTQNLTFA